MLELPAHVLLRPPRCPDALGGGWGVGLQLKAAAAAAVAEERVFARYADDVFCEAGKQQARMESFRAEQRQSLQQTLVRQVEQKAAKDAALKATYKGKIDPHFFGQFATSHR